MGRTRSIKRIAASDIRPENIDWFWEDRLSIGYWSIERGEEGRGKDIWAADVIARATRGELPGEFEGQPVKCELAITEDALQNMMVRLGPCRSPDRGAKRQGRQGEGRVDGPLRLGHPGPLVGGSAEAGHRAALSGVLHP